MFNHQSVDFKTISVPFQQAGREIRNGSYALVNCATIRSAFT